MGSTIRENGVPGKTNKEKPETQAHTPCLGQPSGRRRYREWTGLGVVCFLGMPLGWQSWHFTK